MKSVYRGAQSALSIARLASAAFYGAIAILLIGIATWLVLPPKSSWFLGLIAILVGAKGATFGMKALEIFLSTRPAERPVARQERPSRRG